VVDHSYVDPTVYFYDKRTIDGIPKAVFHAESGARRWCSEHRDICSGVVRRPEAAYIGLTRDHDATIRMLRRTLDIPDPAKLRAFRAPYSESELHPLPRQIRDLVETQFPGEIECDPGRPEPTPPCRPDGLHIYRTDFPAVGRLMLDVRENAPEGLIRALKEAFGDKIQFRAAVAYRDYYEPVYS
jgi:hypothetical protein